MPIEPLNKNQIRDIASYITENKDKLLNINSSIITNDIKTQGNNEEKLVIGIGGSHIYYAKTKNTEILKEDIIRFPSNKEQFFEYIVNYGREKLYIIDSTSKLNIIFSYPFKSIRSSGYIDGIYEKVDIISKDIPFINTSFSINEKFRKIIKQDITINVVNDSVASNIYNYHKNPNYDTYISILSGTGVNLSYIKDGFFINSEVGRLKMTNLGPKFIGSKLLEEYISYKALSKYDLSYMEIASIAASYTTALIIAFIDENKHTCLLGQGSFITKNPIFYKKLISNLREFKNIVISKDNKADIKGVSLL
ncbi:MAG: hypothetical protein ACYDBX_02420 [Patescibacteria group bacterium]